MGKSEKIIKILFIIILYILVIFIISLLIKQLYGKKIEDNIDNNLNNNVEEQENVEINKNSYFEEKDIIDINKDIYSGKKDDLIYYKYYDSINNEEVIAVFEPNEATERTYLSLISFVSLLKGNDETEIFKQNFQKLESDVYEDYEIILNPILNNDIKKTYQEIGVDDTYVITQLKIKMSILDNIKLYEGINKSADDIKEMIQKSKNNISSYSGMPNDNYLELTLIPSTIFTPDESTQEEYINEIINTYIDNNMSYDVSLKNENDIVIVTIKGENENNIELIE